MPSEVQYCGIKRDPVVRHEAFFIWPKDQPKFQVRILKARHVIFIDIVKTWCRECSVGAECSTCTDPRGKSTRPD